jgi:septal ring factor EnvC (AmiA/AmiB activator)
MNRKHIILSGLIIFLCCLAAGCSESKGKRTAAVSSGQNNRILSQPQSTNAVESAIELSTKYAKLSEEMTVMKEKNRALEADNKQLKDELIPSKAQLAQAQKELSEANDLLVEMRVELNNWKSNILGFRGEMRQADTAQLEALVKILTILGAEPDPNQDPNSTVVAMNNK